MALSPMSKAAHVKWLRSQIAFRKKQVSDPKLSEASHRSHVEALSRYESEVRRLTKAKATGGAKKKKKKGRRK